MSERRVARKPERFFDYSLLFCVIFLLGFGLVMLYSTSSYEAGIEYGDVAYYLKRQLVSTIIGLACMFVVIYIDYHFWERFATFAYLLSMVLILLILTPLGMSQGGARRWLNLGLSLQPAEVAKVAIILFLAALICKLNGKIDSLKGFALVLAVPVPIFLMILIITSNLSSAIIIVGIAVVMLFVATKGYKKFILLGSAVAISAAGMVFYIVSSYSSGGGTAGGFRGERILAWLDPEAFSMDKGFQTLQGLYAIGSGGIFGKGLGQSMQKMGFVPEAQNDMIFSIICEELGLFGALAIISLFILLLWRCMIIANNAGDLFGAMLVVGVMGHIAIQVILNIAVVTNTIPNTGVSLPFISYGGSSVMFLLAEMGLVLSVSKGIRLKDK